GHCFTMPERSPIAGRTSISAISKATTGLGSASIPTQASLRGSMWVLAAQMANTSSLSLAASSKRVAAIACAALMLLAGLGAILSSAQRRFYPDDPHWVDDDMSLPVSRVTPTEDTNGYDFLVNTFSTTGERKDIRAFNVNQLDE